MARRNMRNFVFLRTCSIVHIHISIIQIISIPSIFTLIHRLIICDCLDIRIQYYSNFILNLFKISMFIDLSDREVPYYLHYLHYRIKKCCITCSSISLLDSYWHTFVSNFWHTFSTDFQGNIYLGGGESCDSFKLENLDSAHIEIWTS